jgi:hypothetical protein
MFDCSIVQLFDSSIEMNGRDDFLWFQVLCMPVIHEMLVPSFVFLFPPERSEGSLTTLSP